MDPSALKNLKSLAAIIRFALNIQNTIQIHEATDINMYCTVVQNFHSQKSFPKPKKWQICLLYTDVDHVLKRHAINMTSKCQIFERLCFRNHQSPKGDNIGYKFFLFSEFGGRWTYALKWIHCSYPFVLETSSR